MPHNKPRKVKNQLNSASIMEEEREANTSKQNKKPPSLNGVPKM